MNTQRNPVGWFEIYVSDMDRARTFYETVFGFEFVPLSAPDSSEDLELLMFPGDPSLGGACGALAKMRDASPGTGGTLVYFSCRDCGEEEGRVVGAGGSVVKPKFSIGEYGDIALVSDPDGNLVGLHNPPEGGDCGAAS